MTKHVWKHALTACMVLSTGILFAQDKEDSPEVLRRQTDAKEIISSIFSGKHYIDTTKQTHSNFSTLPSAGYNPSVGFAIGVTSTGGKVFGNPKTTTFSVVNANAYLSTNGLASFEAKNNIFTNNDIFNIQGGVQVGRTVALDYGVGTGHKVQGDGTFSIADLPLSNNADVFPIKYTYIKLSERVYRKIFNHVYAGAGVIFNIYNNIDDERKTGPNINTHNFRYSMLNNFPTLGYEANGLLFNIEYNSRDQVNRQYKGIYADIVLRMNQSWLGSDHEAMQLKTELRKYWSLSKVNPEHILAFWYWGCYLLNGSIPYLELPGTGSDASNRIGRAYTIGRFKGTSFAYSEAEYRFPITKNKLLSGVLFTNIESASNKHSINLMEFVEPGVGAGLRLLFNKYTRSNLCIDYGVGNYGSKGIFLGLNEVF
ncbi:BamA/TamA family outer membrane protein [Mucilaginibacter sp.]|uniref:BamA/TamA family outer membrane protein n=1 Tax=Mucilaginibacter sp. TaxID=1882438 RepID=UPI00261BF3DE|nr:BamA/TamA family outer membrane protein [Mucilaginibacter sp.]